MPKPTYALKFATFRYEHPEYGRVTLVPVTQAIKVSDFYGSEHLSKAITLEEAEKIALITGNEGLQPSVIFDESNRLIKDRMFYLIHLTSGVVCVAGIEELVYTGPLPAREELERVNRSNNPFL